MAKTPNAVYIGIRGSVIALDRSTGDEIWRSDLRGADFVNVVLDGDKILATTKGELFCLDAATGQLLWRNELKGMGRGLVSIATANSPSGSALLPAEKKRRDDEAAAAGAAASAH